MVTLEIADAIAWITLNRPRQANAINSQMATEVSDLTVRSVNDPNVKVIVMTGAGKHFCGGADLKAVQIQREGGDPNPTARLCAAVSAVPVPVIAMINGSAVGGGLELALCCDFRVLSSTAMLSLPEIRFGMLPAAGGTQRLPRLVGASRAKSMIMSARAITAARAFEMGLADEVSAPEHLVQATREFAAELAVNARYALVAAKRLIDGSFTSSLEEGLRVEAATIDSMGTPEERAAEKRRAIEGMQQYKKLLG